MSLIINIVITIGCLDCIMWNLVVISWAIFYNFMHTLNIVRLFHYVLMRFPRVLKSITFCFRHRLCYWKILAWVLLSERLVKLFILHSTKDHIVTFLYHYGRKFQLLSWLINTAWLSIIATKLTLTMNSLVHRLLTSILILNYLSEELWFSFTSCWQIIVHATTWTASNLFIITTLSLLIFLLISTLIIYVFHNHLFFFNLLFFYF